MAWFRREPAPDRAPALIDICVDIADRLREVDPALWQRMHRLLADAGVHAVLPDGEPFDPERFDAIGRADTSDERLQLTVASTEFAGYVDGDRVVRRPQVVVYRTEAVHADD
ncbi:nucleotide exchange factor GrpE [Amycolatopsis sp. cg5]|uniref:nucleotide exchange factor GrpE n=1 Tax=Amycolatopsis sp. cg5 TaxID=3238802 RepID=UPI0035264BB0